MSVCGGDILYEGELNHNKYKFLCIIFASWSCVTKFIKIQTVKAATTLSETKKILILIININHLKELKKK